MRLTVVGSSDAFNSAGRNHSCYLLEGACDKTLMVDFGATALAGLKRLGRDPREIGALLITHLHGDHIGGFPFLYLDSIFNLPRVEPLEVVGPLGVQARLDAVRRAAYGDVGVEPPFEIRYREISPGGGTDVFGATVEGFAASHMDLPAAPLCLRVISRGGQVVAFSGDTELCPGLFMAADGADLVVAECTALFPPAGRHITWDDWQDALPKIRARRVLLSHLGESVRANIPNLTPPRGSPPIEFADDGRVIDLAPPSGGSR